MSVYSKSSYAHATRYELSRNAIKKICETEERLQDTFTLQVIEVKQFENSKSKIVAKYKLSDGVSIIIAMVLE